MGDFFSDPLRITLAAVAVVILLGLVFFGRKGSSEPKEDFYKEEDHEIGEEPVLDSGIHFGADEYVGPVRTVSSASASSNEEVNDTGVKKSSVKKEEIEDDQFIVLNLIPQPGQSFSGPDLLQVFKESGLEYGEFKIFHFPHRKDRDKSLFSVVNMVKPGFFDISSMDSFSTTGLSMFMRLPVYGGDNEGTFSNMLATANVMARKLRANIEVQDRTPLTEDKVKQIKQYISYYSKKSQKETTETV